MPIPSVNSGELEDEYIGRCISEIHSEYDAEGQAYAVCKGEWDKGNMSETSFEEMKKLIKAQRG
jgi:hypothetical protein